MTSVPRQLATFAAVLAVLFGVGVIAGQILDPEPDRGDAQARETHGGASGSHETSAAEPGDHAAMSADPVRGLAVAENGLRIVVEDAELARGRSERLRFRVVGDDGRAVRDFEVEHEKRMHFIVVRRDLAGFQHVHPTMSEDGTWSTPLSLDEAGSYRVFADFTRGGEAITLGSDLRVDGKADLQPLPRPAASADTSGGYAVRLDAGAEAAGKEAILNFTITRNGRTIRTEPYLGAGGHLVGLREGDLAFLHVHPTEGLSFAATFPTEGRYRLFLQFKHRGRVQTAAFTQAVSR